MAQNLSPSYPPLSLVQAISQEALEWELNKQNYEQKIQRLQKQLRDANTTRAACDKVHIYTDMHMVDT